MQTDELTEEQEAVELSDDERERGKPMPNITHAAVQLSLGARLLAQAKDQFLVVAELTLEVPQTFSLAPDLAVLPKRSLNWGREPARCKEVPIAVVEIVSPSQGYQVIVDKVDAYLPTGYKACGRSIRRSSTLPFTGPVKKKCASSSMAKPAIPPPA